MRRDQFLGKDAPVQVLDVDCDVGVGGLKRGRELVVEQLLGALLPVREPDFDGDGATGGARASDDRRRGRIGRWANIASSLRGVLLGLTGWHALRRGLGCRTG